MKARKVLKRLNKVNALLASVLGQNAAKKPLVRELLTTAKASVSHAQEAIQAPASAPASKPKPAKKTVRAKSRKQPMKAAKPKRTVKKAKPVARKKTAPAQRLHDAPVRIARAADHSEKVVPQAAPAVPTYPLTSSR